MSTAQTSTDVPVRIAARHTVAKRLGNWTTARQFEVRAHRGVAVLDLRSPRIPAGEIRIHADLDHAMLRLLVPDDAVLDDWDLGRIGRGRVKDAVGQSRTRNTPDLDPDPDPDADADADADAAGGRRIVLTGELRHAEIRVSRAGIAVLVAMFTREYWSDLRRAHRQGGFPTVDDPTRTA